MSWPGQNQFPECAGRRAGEIRIGFPSQSEANARWSQSFVHDKILGRYPRHFGLRQLTGLIGYRGKLSMIVSNYGTESPNVILV
jgi:hypothetical protein